MHHPQLQAFVQQVAMLGPGLRDWHSGQAVLRGAAAYAPARTLVPEPVMLAASERRRVGRVVRLALVAAAQAAQAEDLGTLPTIFASSGGDGENCHVLCETLASPGREVSPTRFMNSVHNAAAAYWSIATGSTAPSTSLSAYDASFGAGLIEALCQLAAGAARVLLVAYDADYPEPLRAVRPISDAFAVALLLSCERGAAPGALSFVRAELSTQAVSVMTDKGLESLRASIPAARCLPLLDRLARRSSQDCRLDYLDDVRLDLQVAPC